jgi:uncharacterized protein YjcR
MFYYYSAEGKRMSEEMKKKVGAPKGNHNSRTHGFYVKALNEEERLNFQQATEVEGLDSEIALTRVKIQSLADREPDNMKMITQAVTALARVMMTKFNISKSDKKTFTEAMENALKDIVIPGGVGVMQFFKK